MICIYMDESGDLGFKKTSSDIKTIASTPITPLTEDA